MQFDIFGQSRIDMITAHVSAQIAVAREGLRSRLGDRNAECFREASHLQAVDAAAAHGMTIAVLSDVA
ncbi:MAG: hypothetical protein ACLP8A_10930 [Methylovirgula sp.]